MRNTSLVVAEYKTTNKNTVRKVYKNKENCLFWVDHHKNNNKTLIQKYEINIRGL